MAVKRTQVRIRRSLVSTGVRTRRTKDAGTMGLVTSLMEKNWQGDIAPVDNKSGKCEKQRRQTGRMFPELQCRH